VFTEIVAAEIGTILVIVDVEYYSVTLSTSFLSLVRLLVSLLVPSDFITAFKINKCSRHARVQYIPIQTRELSTAGIY
jgi:hypothetical protein